jgi:hypothetical protein
MSDRLAELEKILGGKLERADARVVPGTDETSTRQAIYFPMMGKIDLESSSRK